MTFLGLSHEDNIQNAVASLDRFVIGVSTKGKAFTGGGEDFGLNVKSAHSAALGEFVSQLRYQNRIYQSIKCY